MIVNGIKDKDLQGIKFVDNIVSNKKIVGSFVKNTGELTVLNLNHVYDNLNNTYINIQGFGKWYINDLKTDEDATSSILSLYDVTHKFDVLYKDTFSFPATMGAWATWIGEQVGVPLKGAFLNYDKVLANRPYIGENPSFRDAVKLIAKYASSYAQKNYDNTYSIKWFEDTVYKIEDWESFVHGKQKNPVNIIILSTGSTEDNVKWPENQPLFPYELRIEDDWNYINRYEINEAIYNQVNGFLYTPISKLNLPYGIFDLRAGQKIKTQDIELQNIETYISKHILEWQGGDFDNPNAWLSSIEMSELDETSSDYKKANSFENRMLRVERSADKNEGIIQDLIESKTDTSTKLTQLTQTVDEIKGSISEVADVTKSAENIGSVALENINLSEPIYLKIHPTTEDIESTYLEESQYLEENQYLTSRIVRFKNDKGYIVDYELPDDLLILSEAYDEFVLDYMEQTCTITKKIGLNTDGSKYLLTTPIVKTYDYPEIILEEGDYTISLLSYQTGYIFVRLMAKNIYTDQFATKVEMNSQILQTKELISSTVNQKLIGYATASEMNSAIIQKATEITQSISSTYATKDQLNTAKSEIKQTTDSIISTVSSKVGKSEIVSSINQTSEKIKINASKINITATNILDILANNAINMTTKKITISSTNFSVDSTGKITAKAGTIGSWTLTTGKIYGGTSSTGVAVMQMPASNINWVFAAGGTSHSDYGDCLFRVSKKGELFSTAGKIAGWSINTSGLSNGTFFIHNNGYSNIYTYADIVVIRNYMLSKISLTDEDIKHYDLNGDGQVNSADLLLMRQKILNI